MKEQVAAFYIKPRKTVENISCYDVPLFEPQNCDFKLDSNENCFGPSKKVLEGLKTLNEKDIFYYPFYGKTIEAFAKFYNVDKDNILLTNGADEAIATVFNTYLSCDNSVLTVTPTFSMPKIYTQIVGANYIEISYKKKWEFPLDDFLKQLKTNQDIKIVHLTTPNNPTGNVICPNTMEQILTHSKDKLVVIDETYANYCDTSYLDLIKKYNNVVVIKSMSKDFALAGLRLGVVFSNAHNILNLKKVISPYSVNSIAAKAAICALNDSQHFYDVKNRINSIKTKLFELLETCGFVPYKSYANFLLCDFGEKAQFVYQKLKNNNILVKKFENETLKNNIRITIPNEIGFEKIKQLIKTKPTVVFDMDGVLIDVSNSYKTAIKQTYQHFVGVQLDEDEIIKAKNTGNLNNDWDLTQHLIKNAGLDVSLDDIIEKFQSIYWDKGKGVINNETLLISPKVLEELSKEYHIALFTGRPKIEANHSLKHFNIDQYFDLKITMDDLPYHKQKPDILGLTKIYNQIMTNKLFYLGDSTADIICAKKFNQSYDYCCTSLGVDTYNNKDLLFDYGADEVLNNANEILEYLKNNSESEY